RLGVAVSAAETVSMDDSAYGLLCSFLPPIVNPMEEEGLSALDAAVEGVSVSADNVRKAADSYEEAERSHQKPLKGFERDLDATRVREV
ncbi:ESX-1 secretion-associated protein, partial [Prauserella cavernicola]|uniref:ESX-1 secretion-associated protein n=1 Tax=Prauserella cavernicola TaxID=2800127 RepID=UPI001E2CA0D7